MKVVFYIGLVLLSSCKKLNPKTTDNLNYSQFNLATVSDTFKRDSVLEPANSITTASYHPMYLGPSKDSIFLNYNLGEIGYRDYDWIAYNYPDSNDMKVVVDTLQNIGSINTFNLFSSKTLNKSKSIKSYPVFIRNNSTDTLNFGFGNFIPLIMEAKDSLDEWKPIQKEFRYSCGTGLSYIYLPPNEIMITSCKLFEGDFQTKLRLTYGYEKTAISNEFTGQINYSQFNK